MKTYRLITAALLALTIPAGMVIAQSTRSRDRDRDRDRDRIREEDEREVRLDTTFTFNKGGYVELGLVSGDIIVRAWDRSEVQIRASLEEGRIESELTSNRVVLGVRSDRRRLGEGRFELQVPVGTRVVARSTSGDLHVTGVRAAVEARSTSGDVDVSDAADKVTIESVSGDVMGRRLAGDIRAMTTSGDVTLRELSGDIQAGSVSGEVSVTATQSKDLRIETVSGDVEYEGTIDRAGRYELTSHSGGIHIVVPQNASASLSLETFSGELDSDFPITIQPSGDGGGRGRSSRRLDFSLGGGGARVIVETFSGDITLEKGRQR